LLIGVTGVYRQIEPQVRGELVGGEPMDWQLLNRTKMLSENALAPLKKALFRRHYFG